jgi:hypothetical protein
MAIEVHIPTFPVESTVAIERSISADAGGARITNVAFTRIERRRMRLALVTVGMGTSLCRARPMCTAEKKQHHGYNDTKARGRRNTFMCGRALRKRIGFFGM